jgi:hypothetical protein
MATNHHHNDSDPDADIWGGITQDDDDDCCSLGPPCDDDYMQLSQVYSSVAGGASVAQLLPFFAAAIPCPLMSIHMRTANGPSRTCKEQQQHQQHYAPF